MELGRSNANVVLPVCRFSQLTFSTQPLPLRLAGISSRYALYIIREVLIQMGNQKWQEADLGTAEPCASAPIILHGC